MIPRPTPGSGSRRRIPDPESTATSAPGSAAAPPPGEYSPAERVGANECARYLENKQDYLDYLAFSAARWPVATGIIEGACRFVIKDRFVFSSADHVAFCSLKS